MMKKIGLFLVVVLVFSCSDKKSEVQQIEVPQVRTPAKKPVQKGNKSLPGYKLISKSDCMSCHKDTSKLIGPSYLQIAEKYTANDTKMIADKIMQGGSGNWGQVPMQAHPNISEEDALKMVDYIMSFKK